MNKIVFILLLFLSCLKSFGQQEAQYSQYMYNMNMVNPAYVVNEPGTLYLGSLYRMQWAGIEGAPRTANVFANMSLSDKTELSFNYTNDQIGDVLQENTFNVDFAYILNLSRYTRLSFGMKAGVSNLAFDFSGTNVGADPSFLNTTNTLMNIGAGLFLYSDNFYVGLSSPNVLPTDLNVNSQDLYETETQMFAMAGYIIDVNRGLRLKPSAVVKQSIGAPLSFDVSMNALFNEKFEFGLSYRYQDAVSALAAINLAYNFKIGYAYDYSTSKLNSFNSGSHEIILLYNFDFLRSKKYFSPRFF